MKSIKFKLDPFPRIPRIAMPIWWVIWLGCGCVYLMIKLFVSIVNFVLWLFQPNKKKIRRMTSVKFVKKERKGNIRR